MRDLAPRIGEIARLVLGPENRLMSTATELRFGTGGSVSVMTAGDKAGSWFDHEHQVGGGALELIAVKLGLIDGEANKWLEDNLGIDASKSRGSRKIAATYAYTDEAGKLLFEVVRYDPKDFRQRRPDCKGGWDWSTKGVRKTPYRLLELLRAVNAGETIFIVEGEKAVEALRKAGLVATCSPGGAGKWPAGEFHQYMRGADVVVLPDNDDAGRSHANDVAGDLLGVAQVRIVDLAQHHDAFPHKADPADWFALGRTAEDLRWVLEGAEPLPSPPAAPDLIRQPESAVPQPCLAATAWLARELPEPDFLMGEAFGTNSRAMLIADTGLGKTNLGFGLASAMTAGQDFLHWRCRRKARVLYIDGEMSSRLIKRRLLDAARRAGTRLEGLYVINRDDYPDMPPLNMPAGRAFIDQKIQEIGGVDFIIFDNIQALLRGDMKDEEPWHQTLPWIRDLTRRNVGQLWVHHTGHDTSHSYGTKTREWQLDAVILLEAVERPGADIAFALKFTKARERSPHNRADFEAVTITLAADKWSVEGATKKKAKPPEPLGHKFFNALLDALAAPRAELCKIAGHPAVSIEHWKAQCRGLGLIARDADGKDTKIGTSLFNKYKVQLIAADWVACNGDLATPLTTR